MTPPLALALVLAACDPAGLGPAPAPTESDVEPGGTSPRPPLLDPPDAGDDDDEGPKGPRQSDAGLDAAAPEPLTTDAPLASDGLDAVAATTVLEARLAWAARPSGASVPEATEAVRALQAETDGNVTISVLALGRLRIDITGRGMSLPQGSALLAREDRYGTLLVWPRADRFRVIPPGALHSVFADRRVDVTPLSPARVASEGSGERDGQTITAVVVRGALGSVALELLEQPESGRGGPLLCRFLLELAAIDPASDLCDAGVLPIRAEYRWGEANEPGLVFSVTKTTRVEAPTDALLVPPRRGARVRSGLPAIVGDTFFEPRELTALRRAPSERPRDAEAPAEPERPDEGVAAINNSDKLMWLLIDGVPVAAVPPWGRTDIKGLQNGRYTANWRSFFGDQVLPVSDVDVPTVIRFGEPPADAGEQGDAG